MEYPVFFQKKSEQDVALTSTSANHIANIAKECLQTLESDLENIRFIKTEVSLIGNSNTDIIEEGISIQELSFISSRLDRIASIKALIAWLRESIKAKNELTKKVQSMRVEEWCKENKVEYPEPPAYNASLTEEEYYNSLPIKERNRYYQLETIVAVIGKYIHPEGSFANARKELKHKSRNPHTVSGSGRDAIIYTYSPTVSEDKVDSVFFELQKKHREAQAQLNSIKSACGEAVNKSITDNNTKYIEGNERYKSQLMEVTALYKDWVHKTSEEISKLKIIIPNSLIEVYTFISQLGK